MKPKTIKLGFERSTRYCDVSCRLPERLQKRNLKEKLEAKTQKTPASSIKPPFPPFFFWSFFSQSFS